MAKKLLSKFAYGLLILILISLGTVLFINAINRFKEGGDETAVGVSSLFAGLGFLMFGGILIYGELQNLKNK